MLRLDHYEGDDSVVCLSDTATSTTPFYTANIWVFTNMSGMLLVTGESLIIDCNPVFSQLALGYTREQLIGKVCWLSSFKCFNLKKKYSLFRYSATFLRILKNLDMVDNKFFILKLS